MDIEQLDVIVSLTSEPGVNDRGVVIILNMRKKVGSLQSKIQEFVWYVTDRME